MYFNSVPFLIFLPVVFLVYWSLRNHRIPRHLFVAAASYVFYGWWDWRFLSLIAVSTLLDFYVGQGLKITADARKRKLLLLCSLAGNLGILGFFKYFNFFADSAEALLSAVGIDVQPVTLRILLPPGISFYTFQTLSYSIDVYRRRIEPCDSLLDFAVYVAFFPQLVAGPILRASYFLPQMADRMTAYAEKHQDGLFLILRGLCKKILVADVLARCVEKIFGARYGIPDPGSLPSLEIMLASYAFIIQVYCDFSGYSDIAIGCAQLLGFEIPDNFDRPFRAPNLRDFWRRWHISLTTWVRDYIYFPLGGSRVAPLRQMFNVFITMSLMGLWHGANWTFVIWGMFLGVALIAETILLRFLPVPEPGSFQARFRICFGVLFTFSLVAFSCIFFRAESASHAFALIGRLFSFRGGLHLSHNAGFYALLTFAGLAMQWLPGRWVERVRIGFAGSGVLLKTAVIMLLFSVFALVQESANPFVYFQF